MISRLIADRNIEHTDLLQSEDLCGQGKCKSEISHNKLKGDCENFFSSVCFSIFFSSALRKCFLFSFQDSKMKDNYLLGVYKVDLRSV